mgnify:CR=1 FL=1
MTATYDPTDLTNTTGKINIVRLMLGDTDVATPELQDEELQYYIDLSPNNLYLADGQRYSGTAIFMYAGGIPTNPLEKNYSFYRGQFHYDKVLSEDVV